MHVKLRAGWRGTYPELTEGNRYRVISIRPGLYRLINDCGEPIMYHAKAFDIVDARRPADWVTSVIEGDVYEGVPFMEVPGFFEKWHDRDPGVIRQFSAHMYRLSWDEVAAWPNPNTFFALVALAAGPAEPTHTYLEISPDGDVVRRVELFADGTLGYADAQGGNGRTELDRGPLPARLRGEHAAACEEQVISAQEFEVQLDRAVEAYL